MWPISNSSVNRLGNVLLKKSELGSDSGNKVEQTEEKIQYCISNLYLINTMSDVL